MASDERQPSLCPKLDQRLCNVVSYNGLRRALSLVLEVKSHLYVALIYE